jgi:subtilase family serine protease
VGARSPDLIVQSISRGQSFTPHFDSPYIHIRNIGPEPVKQDFGLRVWINGQAQAQLLKYEISKRGYLMPNASYTFKAMMMGLPSRTCRVAAKVDATFQVHEQREDNNRLEKDLPPLPPLRPDLQIIHIYPEPGPGGRKVPYVTVGNLGTSSVTRNFQVRLWTNGMLRGEMTYDVSKRGPLRPGFAATLKANAVVLLPGQSVEVRAYADATGRIRESNESNNEKTRQL